MKKSFRNKIISAFLIVIVLSMGALTLLSNVLLMPVFIHNSKNTMIKYFPVIDSALAVSLSETRAVLEEMNQSYGITAYIVDENGKVICSYSKIKSNKTNKQRNIKLINLYNDRDFGEDFYFRNKRDETDNIKKLLFVRKTSDGHYVLMNKAVKGIEQDIKIVSFFLMALCFTVAVLGTAVWAVFTRKLTDNIEKISVITHKMSRLDFSEKINLSQNDEIGVLADSIDLLSDELEESINGLKEDIERQKRLIRDISHELKTPVTTVKGYIENIEAVAESNPTLQSYCRIASEECDVIDNLVEEMLEMSRLESQGYVCDKEIIPVCILEKTIAEKLSVEFRECEFKLSFDKADILCNPILIVRAVMNFIKNAVKYGDKGSAIEVDGYVEDGSYIFSVANKGKEIPESEKENIWDLFYKNDKSRQRNESHGIGLSMVRQIAVLHNGAVSLECKDGKNIFSFSVPMN